MGSKEVTILGSGPTLDNCLFDTPEIWTQNNGWKLLQGTRGFITKLFLMHKQVVHKRLKVPIFNWAAINLSAQLENFEVISLHRIDGLKSTPYPYKEIVEHFGTDYFSNSPSYMIAYALYHKFDVIKFYGCNFYVGVSDDHDDLLERCGTEYWIGVANGMGVKTLTDKDDNLMQTRTGKPYAIDG